VSALYPSSPIYRQPTGATEGYYYYQAIVVTVPGGGNYSFTSGSSLDTVGYFYSNSFDPYNPSVNLVTFDDNSGIETQFRIEVALQTGSTYILVVTTSQVCLTGLFWIKARGPASVSLTLLMPSEGKSIGSGWMSYRFCSLLGFVLTAIVTLFNK
jgi:hypothetical protein